MLQARTPPPPAPLPLPTRRRPPNHPPTLRDQGAATTADRPCHRQRCGHRPCPLPSLLPPPPLIRKVTTSFARRFRRFRPPTLHTQSSSRHRCRHQPERTGTRARQTSRHSAATWPRSGQPPAHSGSGPLPGFRVRASVRRRSGCTRRRRCRSCRRRCCRHHHPSHVVRRHSAGG